MINAGDQNEGVEEKNSEKDKFVAKKKSGAVRELAGALGRITLSAASAVYGIGELLIHDLRDVGSFVLVCVMPHHIQVRFQEQVSVKLLSSLWFW